MILSASCIRRNAKVREGYTLMESARIKAIDDRTTSYASNSPRHRFRMAYLVLQAIENHLLDSGGFYLICWVLRIFIS